MSEPTLTTQTPGDVPVNDAAKLEALAAGTLDDLLPALPGLDEIQLDELLILETAGKKRTTALGAIQREIDARDAPPTAAELAADAPAQALYDDTRTKYANKRARDVDPGKISKPYLTLDGWVVPHPSAQPQG